MNRDPIESARCLAREVLAATDWLFESRPLTLDSLMTSHFIALRVRARETLEALPDRSDEERQAEALRTERWGRLAARQPR